MTGGGAVKYIDLIKAKFSESVTITHVDEMKSLANGIRYSPFFLLLLLLFFSVYFFFISFLKKYTDYSCSFLGALPGEVFTYNTTTNAVEDLPQLVCNLILSLLFFLLLFFFFVTLLLSFFVFSFLLNSVHRV